ncbi:MAG: hypothetical protein GY754_22460 [bacterium]|nr:hypothetical protein [bacterium]
MKIVVIAIAAVIVGIAVFTACKKLSGGFDSEKWKALHKSPERNNPRITMVPDLQRSIIKKGMQKNKVRELLGPPEMIDKNSETYDLGVSSYGIDFEYFIIKYDSAEKVSRSYITRD